MGRSEGHAVVAANAGGQAALFKKPFKYGESVVFSGRRKRLTSEEKAAGVIRDRQRIAILTIAQQELAFVIGAPQFVGALPHRESRTLSTTAHAAATLHQTVAIQHRMNGALGGDGNAGKSTEQALANLSRTPAGMLALHVQDEVFHLEGQLVGVAIGAAASVGQPLNAALLIAIENLVPGFARDPELSAEFRHRLAG